MFGVGYWGDEICWGGRMLAQMFYGSSQCILGQGGGRCRARSFGLVLRGLRILGYQFLFCGVKLIICSSPLFMAYPFPLIQGSNELNVRTPLAAVLSTVMKRPSKGRLRHVIAMIQTVSRAHDSPYISCSSIGSTISSSSSECSSSKDIDDANGSGE